ncbi:hypothetical protein VSR01_10835 [Actinacidiphila sp. DG2A-62]|uniref:hypothetical protein n=1 Tax=Actinacidiphila sp. DG2A-62 TaxID=3108821 RepID=UPI002DBE71CA|nr:hypothetical protein [Actinacidiphila sp. DG2A-62]MEC3994014.1 hypothetical protein [Actinacidiphila sp. DG2A-62]
MSRLATAPANTPGMGGHVLGSITLSGVALACALVLFFAVRKADRLKHLHSRDGIGAFGILTGTAWTAAGSSWAAAASGIAAVPTSVLGDGSGMGNPGAGGTALALTALTFLPGWKRTLWPALLGISAAVVYGAAGGVWGLLVTTARMLVGKLTGAA